MINGRGDIKLPETVKFAIYFNVLLVIVLEEAAEQFSPEPLQEEPQAFGVDGILEYVETLVDTVVKVAEEVESVNEEMQRPFCAFNRTKNKTR